MARLDSAYQERGHAALEEMQGVEPLALRNEKVRDYKLAARWLEAHPDDTAIRREQNGLVGEINDLTKWINEKIRQQSRSIKPVKSMDMER